MEPTQQAKSQEELFQEIKDILARDDVVLFMKGTHQMPRCGFSSRVVQILDYLSVTFRDVNMLERPGMHAALKVFSDFPTLPQLYIRGELVGGCDIVSEMFASQELQALLNKQAQTQG